MKGAAVPIWLWIAVIVGVAVLTAVLVVLAFLAWRAWERRLLLGLVVRAAAADAVGAAFYDIVKSVSDAQAADFDAFVADPNSTERRALSEVRDRSRMLVEELDHLALPRRFVRVAEALADAAQVVVEEVETVEEAVAAEEPGALLMAVDLTRVRAYAQRARLLLTDACKELGLEDTAVYGGGLYL